MGVFKSERRLRANPSMIPGIAEAVKADFKRDGFAVQVINLVSGGVDISLAKGGAFKAILGMKSALKITMFPKGDAIELKAGVGVFGQQAVPTVISVLFFWPVLIAQVWGLVKQSGLDDRAIAVAERYVDEHGVASSAAGSVSGFCTACGQALPGGAKFCSNCGGRVC